MAKLADISDHYFVSQEGWQKVYNAAARATDEAGFDKSCTPVPPLNDLQAILHGMNKTIASQIQVYQTVNHGWRNDVDQCLQAMVALGKYTSSFDSLVLDTIAPAFGTDKCPFLHKCAR